MIGKMIARLPARMIVWYLKFLGWRWGLTREELRTMVLSAIREAKDGH